MKKYIIAFISTFLTTIVASILPGILFYAPKQIEWSQLFPGVVNETPDPLFMLIASVALIILCIVSFDKMGINNIKKGAVTGAWFGALIFTFFGFQFMGVTNILSIEFVLTDIFISSIVGAIQGAAIGWSLGKFK
jgi:hypothetical protein